MEFESCVIKSPFFKEPDGIDRRLSAISMITGVGGLGPTLGVERWCGATTEASDFVNSNGVVFFIQSRPTGDGRVGSVTFTVEPSSSQREDFPLGILFIGVSSRSVQCNVIHQ